jgi:hypothetical protein
VLRLQEADRPWGRRDFGSEVEGLRQGLAPQVLQVSGEHLNHRCTQGGWGGGEGGGIKVYPPSKIFTTPIYPPSQNLTKTSLTLPLDFQTVCIYDLNLFKAFFKTSLNLNLLKTIYYLGELVRGWRSLSRTGIPSASSARWTLNPVLENFLLDKVSNPKYVYRVRCQVNLNRTPVVENSRFSQLFLLKLAKWNFLMPFNCTLTFPVNFFRDVWVNFDQNSILK